jgi:hypothetical protein
MAAMQYLAAMGRSYKLLAVPSTLAACFYSRMVLFPYGHPFFAE